MKNGCHHRTDYGHHQVNLIVWALRAQLLLSARGCFLVLDNISNSFRSDCLCIGLPTLLSCVGLGEVRWSRTGRVSSIWPACLRRKVLDISLRWSFPERPACGGLTLADLLCHSGILSLLLILIGFLLILESRERVWGFKTSRGRWYLPRAILRFHGT